ncbi:MAG: hypothetical protein AAFN13_14430 [Bacteroidota bacterium]
MSTQLTFTAGLEEGQRIQQALTERGVTVSTRRIRSFDGDAEALKIGVEAAKHVVKKLIDAISEALAKVFKRKEEHGQPEVPSKRINVSMQVGEMMVSIENIPVERVMEVIEALEKVDD